MSVDLDRQLQEYCRLMDEAQVSLSFDDILERSGELQVIPGRSNRHPSPRRRWIAAAAVALALLVLAIGIRLLPIVDVSPADQPTTTSPPGAMAWDPGRFTQDWPGPLRPEPAGGDADVGILDESNSAAEERFTDPVGDAGMALVDISQVLSRVGCWWSLTTERCAFFDTVAPSEPMPSPADTWIAYGIVVDYTGDGRPDVRFGIDNARDPERSCPLAAAIGCRTRMWRTDLNTGETLESSRLEDPTLPPRGAGMDADVPSLDDPDCGSCLGHIWVQKIDDEQVFRFYVWASVIQDGNIVATDYAPDAGWVRIGTTEQATTTTSEPKIFQQHTRLPGYEAGEYWFHPETGVGFHNPTDESSGVHLGISMSPPAGTGCPVSIDFRCFELAELETVPTVVAGHEGIYFQSIINGVRTEVWEIEVEGTKMTIFLSAEPDVTEAELAEGHSIVDSIRTEPWENEAGFRIIFTIPAGWDSA